MKLQLRTEPVEAPRTPAKAASPLRAGVAVLGVPIDHVNLAEAASLIDNMIQTRRPHHVATVGMRSLVLAREDDELRHILLSADLVLCESRAALLASHYLGNRLPGRIEPGELMQRVLVQAATRKSKVYFLGRNTAETARYSQETIARYPGLVLAGCHAPETMDLHAMDHDDIVSWVRAAAPDLLIVGFGSPIQEKWIAMNLHKLGVPVCMGAGSWFHILATEGSRTPAWLRRTGLPWLSYHALHPSAFMERYLRRPWVFTSALRRQMEHQRRSASAKQNTAAIGARPSSGPAPRNLDPDDVILLPATVDSTYIEQTKVDWNARAEKSRTLYVDCSAVALMDSTGLGGIIRLNKVIRAEGGLLILVQLSPAVANLLSTVKLNSLFSTAPNLAAAQQKAEELRQPTGLSVRWGRAGASANIYWRGQVTVQTIEDLWQRTDELLIERAHDESSVAIDLSGVTQIDSFGLHSMMRMSREAERSGVKLRFTGLSDTVRRAVQQAGLAEVLNPAA